MDERISGFIVSGSFQNWPINLHLYSFKHTTVYMALSKDVQFKFWQVLLVHFGNYQYQVENVSFSAYFTYALRTFIMVHWGKCRGTYSKAVSTLLIT